MFPTRLDEHAIINLLHAVMIFKVRWYWADWNAVGWSVTFTRSFHDIMIELPLGMFPCPQTHRHLQTESHCNPCTASSHHLSTGEIVFKIIRHF